MNVYDLLAEEFEAGADDILKIDGKSLDYELKGEDGETALEGKPKFSEYWQPLRPYKGGNAELLKAATAEHGLLLYDDDEPETYPNGRIYWALRDTSVVKPIKWKDLEAAFGSGKLSEPFGRAVGHLRAQTMWFLLNAVTGGDGRGIEAFADSKVCYAESGIFAIVEYTN